MLAKDHRFHGYGGLRFVYRHGQTVRGQYMALRYVANKKAGYRCSVVVSRSVSKSAVVRNRIRRRIYELMAGRLSAAGAAASYDLLITVFQAEVANWPAPRLAEVVDKLLAELPTDAGLTKAKGSHAIINTKENK